ncbi:MAG: hypothetical protein PUA61_08360 [Succinatimonas hippei]|nr:hypothetical protein [Succinatimonas hippei]
MKAYLKILAITIICGGGSPSVLANESVAATAVDVKPASALKIVYHPVLNGTEARYGADSRGSGYYKCTYYPSVSGNTPFLIYKGTPGSQTVVRVPDRETHVCLEYHYEGTNFGSKKVCSRYGDRNFSREFVLTANNRGFAVVSLAVAVNDLKSALSSLSSLPVESSSHVVLLYPSGSSYDSSCPYSPQLRNGDVGNYKDVLNYSY